MLVSTEEAYVHANIDTKLPFAVGVKVVSGVAHIAAISQYLTCEFVCKENDHPW